MPIVNQSRLYVDTSSLCGWDGMQLVAAVSKYHFILLRSHVMMRQRWWSQIILIRNIYLTLKHPIWPPFHVCSDVFGLYN